MRICLSEVRQKTPQMCSRAVEIVSERALEISEAFKVTMLLATKGKKRISGSS